MSNTEDLREHAIDLFYSAWGLRLDWDQRQELHWLREYATHEELLTFIEG